MFYAISMHERLSERAFQGHAQKRERHLHIKVHYSWVNELDPHNEQQPRGQLGMQELVCPDRY